MRYPTLSLAAICLTAIAVLGGCTTTEVRIDHPQLAKIGDDYAKVYFLRKMPQRTRGVADDDLRIEIDKQPLLELARGEYSLLSLKPGRVDVVVHSKTMLTTQPAPQPVWRSRSFDFEAGKTYYVYTKFFQEEWRGIYFVPTAIDKQQAMKLAEHMEPAGVPAETYSLDGNSHPVREDNSAVADVQN
jgi:hypothetical protein